MTSTGAIRAGRAYVELYADDSKLSAGLKRAQARLRAFGQSLQTAGLRIAALGGTLTAGFAASVREFVKTGHALEETAKRTGMSVEGLSALAYAAERSGTGMEEVEVGVRRFQKALYDAEGGSSKAKDALDALGLSVRDFQGLSPDRQFALVASRLRQVPDPAHKAALTMVLLGRSGTALLPLIQDLDALTAQGRRLGAVMSREDAEAASRLHDAFEDLWQVLRSVMRTVGESLTPMLMGLTKKLTDVVIGLRTWVDANREVAASIAAVTAAIVAAGVAITTVGTVIRIGSWAFGAMAVPTRLLVGAIAGVTAAMVALRLVSTGAEAGMDPLRREMTRIADEADGLVNRYAELVRKTDRTVSEGYELEDVTKRLKDLFPKYAVQIDGTAESLKELNEQTRILSEGGAQRAIQVLEDRIKELKAKPVEFPKPGLLGRAGSWIASEYHGMAATGRDYLSLVAPETAKGIRIGPTFQEQFAREQDAFRKAMDQRAAELASLEVELARLKESLGKKPTPVTPEKTEEAKRIEEQSARDLVKLRHEQIADEFKREEALIKDRYDDEVKRAQDAGADIATVEQRRAVELDAARRKYAEKQAKEAERVAKDQADIEQRLNDDVEEARIRATLKSHAQERALLELERQKAMREMLEAGLGLTGAVMVNRLFNLREQIQEQGWAVDQKVSVAGTFNPMAAWGLGAERVFDRIARASEETARNTRGRLGTDPLPGGLVYA